ncbi:MAG: hypothetical protein PVG66_12135 [Chromatiales bacterium]|jgi:hypothetical protein
MCGNTALPHMDIFRLLWENEFFIVGLTGGQTPGGLPGFLCKEF